MPTYNQIYERERDSLLNILEANRQMEYKKAYRVKTIRAGKQLEVQLYEVWDTKSRNKSKAEKPSRERQEKLNEEYSKLRCVRLINANFTEKDSWITLTYTALNRPATEEQAEKNIKNYIARVKRAFQDIDLKYVYTIEHGDSWTHHHVVCNVSDRDRLEELWASKSELARKRKNPAYYVQQYGRTNARRLQPDDFCLTGLARYISKEGSGRNKKKFVCSKNLIKPEETVTKTLKGRRLTRAFVKKLAEDKAAAKLELLKLFPEYQFNDIEVKQTPYTKGYYVYARLKYISDSGGRTVS